jgi:hypothetical protein
LIADFVKRIHLDVYWAMMKPLLPFLFTAALLLAGCPYASEFPLGDPSEAAADAALLGAWKPAVEAEKEFTLTLLSSGGGRLQVTAESPEGERASYPAFVWELGAERFLNLREQAESGPWYLVNYRLEGGRLLLRLVDDELFEGRELSGPAELRDFLQRHLDDPRLYGGTREWDWVLEPVLP